MQYCSLRWVQGQTCVIEPLLQQWLEFAHVLKAQIQGLKARDGCLAEVVSIQLPHGKANIPLVRRKETEREKERKRNVRKVSTSITINFNANITVTEPVRVNQSILICQVLHTPV